MASSGCSARLDNPAARASEINTDIGREDQGAVECGLQLALEENRRKPDADFAERSAVALDRQPHFVHRRLAVNDRNLAQEAAANQSLEIGPLGQRLPSAAASLCSIARPLLSTMATS